MVYPLPTELGARIFQAMMKAGVPAELHDALYDEFAKLIVRANRQMIRQVARLGRDFADTAEDEVTEYGTAVSAYAGKETCKHIVNEILKPHVYFNTEQAKRKRDEVDKLIQDIFDADPPA